MTAAAWRARCAYEFLRWDTRDGRAPMNMTLGCSALRRLSAGSVSMTTMTAQQIGRIQGSSLRLPQTASRNHAWTCWNPGNALPLQTEVFEAWPRRGIIAPVCVHAKAHYGRSTKGESL